jgi:hypothetical protein
MKRLTADQNIRSHVFSKRFDILTTLSLIDTFDQKKVYTNSDIHQVFAELRENQTLTTLTHFNTILTIDQGNI